MTSTLRGLRAVFATMLIAILAAGTAVSRAEVIGPEQAVSPQGQAEQERARVQEFLDRANVRDKLQALGVDGLTAHGRVDAMSQEEVHALAERIDAIPAGGALGQSDWILILLIAILLVLVL